MWGGVGDQVVGTAMLLLCVCAITDKNNMRVSKQAIPFFVGKNMDVDNSLFYSKCNLPNVQV